MRTPTAFVAAITASGPKLEAVVGSLTESDSLLENSDDLRELAQVEVNGQYPEQLQRIDGFIIWQHYWIRPLYDQNDELLLGILGIRARAEAPNLSDEEQDLLDRLVAQAASALADRIIQQQVFATVEGILPEITAFQERRSAAAFGGLRVLTADQEEGDNSDDLGENADFTSMVRDALTHFWGGPKLTESPLMRLKIVQEAMIEHDNNPTNALRAILIRAIEQQKPEGERSMTTAEWILYNILELKFIQGGRVRDVARRLAMSESDLYRKQRVAIENVARTIEMMEDAVAEL
jgi:GAF domain-containing protein